MQPADAVSIREEIAALLSDFAGQSKTLTIPRPYLELCDGDHIKALFFSQLVYWSGKEGKWFFKSYLCWGEELGLSERQIRRVTKELEDEKIVETYLGKEASRPVLHYRVCRDFLGEWILTKRKSRFLRNARVDSYETSESKYKENEHHVHEHHVHETSVGFIPDKQTPITEATLKWLAQRFKDAGRKLSGPEKRALAEWLSEREETEEQIDVAILGFLADPYWAQKNFPVDAFKKQFQKFLDQGVPAADTPVPDPLPPPRELACPPVELPPVELPPVQNRDYPGEWNAKVPEAQVTWNPKHSPVAALRDCVSDPDFQTGFSEVCRVAHEIHMARGAEVAWLSFEWILRKKAEGYGWYRIAWGDLRSMAMANSKPESSDAKLIRELKERQSKSA